jgi:2-dehydrotetronate isomerase
MIKLAANLSFLFTEVPYLDRYGCAAAAGFRGVECLFPYDYAPEAIATRLEAHALEQVLLNAPPGDWGAGDRGLAALPGREADFRSSLDQAIEYAKATGARRLHVMAGIASPDDARARATYLLNLEHAAWRCKSHDITVLIEPLNPRDMPGYFLADFDDACRIIRMLGIDNVRLQFDVYHRYRLHGEVLAGLKEAARYLGHVQLAGVPMRGQPDQSELPVPQLFATLDALGYDGWIGCEYHPRGRTEESLGWMRDVRPMSERSDGRRAAF